MPWLRLWHEFLNNPKVRGVTGALPARYAGVTEALRARYVDLLCLACQKDDCGRLPNLEEIGFALRLDPKETLKTMDFLMRARLIDRHARSYYIHDWDQWQHTTSKAAERQKRYRAKRNAQRNALRHALRHPPDNALRNGAVTRSVIAHACESEELRVKSNTDRTVPYEPQAPRACTDAGACANADACTDAGACACEATSPIPPERRALAAKTKRRLDGKQPGTLG